MIEYMNEHYGDKYLFKYSTPSQYIDAIKSLQSPQPRFPILTTDMFPYSTGDVEWWTGYFSSRPNLKSSIRYLSSFLHASGSLYSQKMLETPNSWEEIDRLK